MLQCSTDAKAAFIIYGILLELCELWMPFKKETADSVVEKLFTSAKISPRFSLSMKFLSDILSFL